MREQGYFVGSIYINLLVTELLIGFCYVLGILLLPPYDNRIYAALFVLAIVTPVLFHHHARSLWLSVDHIIDPPKGPLEENDCAARH